MPDARLPSAPAPVLSLDPCNWTATPADSLRAIRAVMERFAAPSEIGASRCQALVACDRVIAGEPVTDFDVIDIGAHALNVGSRLRERIVAAEMDLEGGRLSEGEAARRRAEVDGLAEAMLHLGGAGIVLWALWGDRSFRSALAECLAARTVN